ncbi:hypothetical protein A2U01_0052336, partial [Trifolium medium]|nr:hypothetical protein [Trifolium medium]
RVGGHGGRHAAAARIWGEGGPVQVNRETHVLDEHDEEQGRE